MAATQLQDRFYIGDTNRKYIPTESELEAVRANLRIFGFFQDYVVTRVQVKHVRGSQSVLYNLECTMFIHFDSNLSHFFVSYRFINGVDPPGLGYLSPL